MRILFQLNKTNQQRQFQKLVWIFPIKLAMYATALRNQGNEVSWDGIDDGSFDKVITSESQIDIPFLQLPHADRTLTDAFNPKWQNNGNFKYRPGAYIQSSNTCWYKKCSFCKETIDNQPYELRSVDNVISEIENCKKLKVREVFDDSGTFPMGDWLDRFCDKLSAIDGIRFGCNMRMVDCDWGMLRKAGFRMVLFGLESANQPTLDKINKGVQIEKAIEVIKKASRAGLEPHIAVMFGYPWENDADAMRTLETTWYLLRKGFAKTAQASYYSPPDGRNQESHRKFIRKIYLVSLSLEFWFNQLKDIKDKDDLRYLWRKIKAGCLQGESTLKN